MITEHLTNLIAGILNLRETDWPRPDLRNLSDSVADLPAAQRDILARLLDPATAGRIGLAERPPRRSSSMPPFPMDPRTGCAGAPTSATEGVSWQCTSAPDGSPAYGILVKGPSRSYHCLAKRTRRLGLTLQQFPGEGWPDIYEDHPVKYYWWLMAKKGPLAAIRHLIDKDPGAADCLYPIAGVPSHYLRALGEEGRIMRERALQQFWNRFPRLSGAEQEGQARHIIECAAERKAEDRGWKRVRYPLTGFESAKHLEAERVERVSVAAGCFELDKRTGTPALLMLTPNLDAGTAHARLKPYPVDHEWAVRLTKSKKGPSAFVWNDYLAEGYDNPEPELDLLLPDTVENGGKPGVGCFNSALLCSPYLKVELFGSHIFVCMLGVELYAKQRGARAALHYDYRWEPIHEKKRDTFGGWRCRAFPV